MQSCISVVYKEGIFLIPNILTFCDTNLFFLNCPYVKNNNVVTRKFLDLIFFSWGSSQYLPLIAIPCSLALISPQDWAGISGTEPNETLEKEQYDDKYLLDRIVLFNYQPSIISTRNIPIWPYFKRKIQLGIKQFLENCNVTFDMLSFIECLKHAYSEGNIVGNAVSQSH